MPANLDAAEDRASLPDRVVLHDAVVFRIPFSVRNEEFVVGSGTEVQVKALVRGKLRVAHNGGEAFIDPQSTDIASRTSAANAEAERTGLDPTRLEAILRTAGWTNPTVTKVARESAAGTFVWKLRVSDGSGQDWSLFMTTDAEVATGSVHGQALISRDR